jgi:hypothetical protein
LKTCYFSLKKTLKSKTSQSLPKTPIVNKTKTEGGGKINISQKKTGLKYSHLLKRPTLF